MTYPREENLDELLAGKEYIENVGWRLFDYLEGDNPGRHVLITMGDKYTLLDAQTYMQLTRRILSQL